MFILFVCFTQILCRKSSVNFYPGSWTVLRRGWCWRSPPKWETPPTIYAAVCLQSWSPFTAHQLSLWNKAGRDIQSCHRVIKRRSLDISLVAQWLCLSTFTVFWIPWRDIWLRSLFVDIWSPERSHRLHFIKQDCRFVKSVNSGVKISTSTVKISNETSVL